MMMVFPPSRILRSIVLYGALAAIAGVVALGVSPSQLTAQQSGEAFTEEELDRNPHLTPARRKLILAFENYIGHFPTDTLAKSYLINMATVFQNVGDQRTSIEVFGRVMRRPDLTRSDRAYAYEQVMAAYRALHEYDQELTWAHRMARADVGRDKQRQAKQFIFRAGYNQARALQDSGRLLEAGHAYSRLSVMNPDHDQAPNAMLIAAQMYEQSGDQALAAQTYERFYYTYPDYRDEASNTGALAALETAAVLYHEMGDQRHTADAMERILSAEPQHPRRQQYMNNLAAIYSLLNDHNNAIRVRQSYIDSYPEDVRSGDYLWDIARLRGEAGQRRLQLTEYERFIANYPNNWRTIEANYIIGKDRLDQRDRELDRGNGGEAEGLLVTARRHFERSYMLNDSLESQEQGAGDQRHARLSAVEVSKMDSVNYYKISLVGSSNFSDDSTRKWQALIKASRMYIKVAEYQDIPTTFQALYRRGELFEDFSREYLKQPRPDTAITYDQILQVFFINKVAEDFLNKLALEESYQQRIVQFYEENQTNIDSVAMEDPELDRREAHKQWIERARERIETIPRIVDSLRFNTIGYQADLLVANAREKIPETFERGWTRFEEMQQARYADAPRLRYSDKQTVFDMHVAPMVYGPENGGEEPPAPTEGEAEADSAAGMVQEFQQIIADGERLGATQEWILYNRGRLRLVYAARSNYFRAVAHEGIAGLGEQIDTLKHSSESVAVVIEGLPEFDISQAGEMPERPDLTPPAMPERPPGPPTSWTREQQVAFVAAFRRYQQRIADIRWLANRYRRRVERWRERVEALKQEYAAQHRSVLLSTRDQLSNFANQARETHIYRAHIEQYVIDPTSDALEKDIAFGDSVGYSDLDRQAVRDSALSYALVSAQQLDSLYQVVQGIRREYEHKRDTAEGGEGSYAFQFIGNLVTPYAALADSFKIGAIRRYTYIYDGRDSIFTVGLENEIVQTALRRLKQLDPTFGERMVPIRFTFVTEDSSATWRTAVAVDQNNQDAWKAREFDDSSWLPAMRGALPEDALLPPEPVQADTTAATDSTSLSGTTDSTAAVPAYMEPPPSRVTGFEEYDSRMRDIWAPTAADTVYFRYNFQLPPRFSELPDSLRQRERPIPIVKDVNITITADDDYSVYLNGEVTNARDVSHGIVDWQNARKHAILKDQLSVGDTANVMGIMTVNESRTDRYPMTDTSSYGLVARIDVDMEVPLDIWEILYKPPEPEPEFVVQLTHEDSVMLADTTYRYFASPAERERWLDCRIATLRAVWTDSVLTPWRVRRAQTQIADLDTQIVRLKRWLMERAQEAEQRIAEAATQGLGVEGATEEIQPSPGTENGYDDYSNGDNSSVPGEAGTPDGSTPVDGTGGVNGVDAGGGTETSPESQPPDETPPDTGVGTDTTTDDSTGGETAPPAGE